MILSFTIVSSSLLILAQSKPLVREDWPSFDVVCPESEDGYAVFAPHPYDCSLYYECVGVTPVLMTCPGVLEFDIQLNVCNWPELANCQPKTTTAEALTSTTTEAAETTTTEGGAVTTATEVAANTTTTEAAAETTTTEVAAETTTTEAAAETTSTEVAADTTTTEAASETTTKVATTTTTA